MNKQNHIVAILVKHALRQRLEEAEEKALAAWRGKSAEHLLLTKQLRDGRWLEDQRRQLHNPPTAEMWEEVRQYINGIGDPAPIYLMNKRHKIGYRWLAIAAVLGLVLTLGIVKWQWVPSHYAPTTAIARRVILKSGNQTVRLDSLAEGKQLTLESAIVLKKTGAESYQFQSLTSGQHGQAWFDVDHDPAQPVTVQLPEGGRVVVLGTRFQIQVAAGKASRIALANGAVRVVHGEDSAELKPGQEVALSDRLKVNAGHFDFHNADLPTMAAAVAGWYGLTMCNPQGVRGQTITGGLSREVPLERIIADLQFLQRGHAHIELRKDTLLITR